MLRTLNTVCVSKTKQKQRTKSSPRRSGMMRGRASTVEASVLHIPAFTPEPEIDKGCYMTVNICDTCWGGHSEGGGGGGAGPRLRLRAPSAPGSRGPGAQGPRPGERGPGRRAWSPNQQHRARVPGHGPRAQAQGPGQRSQARSLGTRGRRVGAKWFQMVPAVLTRMPSFRTSSSPYTGK